MRCPKSAQLAPVTLCTFHAPRFTETGLTVSCHVIHAANQSRSRPGRERRLSLPTHGGLDDVDSGGLTRGRAEQGATAQATALPDALTCVICLQPLADGPCEALLCGHVFHTQCIEQLAAIRQLPKADTCPLKCGMSASRSAAAAAAMTGSPSLDSRAPADSEAPAAPPRPSRPDRGAPAPVSPARSSGSPHDHDEQEDGGAPAAEAGGAEEGDNIDQAIELAMAQATADAAVALAE